MTLLPSFLGIIFTNINQTCYCIVNTQLYRIKKGVVEVIHIALCDDNGIQLELLKDSIDAYKRQRGIEFEADSYLLGTDLLSEIAKGSKYDVVILDMIMPNMNGIEVAREMRKEGIDSKIIFLTATMDYVLDSFDVDAAHYLLKPLNVPKLYEVLDKVLADMMHKNSEDTIVVKSVQGPMNIRIEEIKYIEKRDRAVCYCMLNGDNIEGLSLRESFAAAIDPFLKEYNFELSSISTATNLSQVASMKGDEIFMKDGEVIFCSRSKTTSFRKSLNDYWAKKK